MGIYDIKLRWSLIVIFLLTFKFMLLFSSGDDGANGRTRRSLVPRTTLRVDIVGRLMAGPVYRRSRTRYRKREAL